MIGTGWPGQAWSEGYLYEMWLNYRKDCEFYFRWNSFVYSFISYKSTVKIKLIFSSIFVDLFMYRFVIKTCIKFMPLFSEFELTWDSERYPTSFDLWLTWKFLQCHMFDPPFLFTLCHEAGAFPELLFLNHSW